MNQTDLRSGCREEIKASNKVLIMPVSFLLHPVFGAHLSKCWQTLSLGGNRATPPWNHMKRKIKMVFFFGLGLYSNTFCIEPCFEA